MRIGAGRDALDDFGLCEIDDRNLVPAGQRSIGAPAAVGDDMRRMRADFHSGDGLRQSLRIEHHQDPSARIGVGMSIVIRSVRVIGGRAPDRQQQISVRRQIDIVRRHADVNGLDRTRAEIDGADRIAALVGGVDGPAGLTEGGWCLAGVRRQPGLHFDDLAFLRRDDLVRPLPGLRIVAVLLDDLRHVDRTLMMRDHAPDEGDIRIAGHHAFHHRSVHFIHRGDVGLREVGSAGKARWGAVSAGCGHSAVHAPLHHLLHRLHHGLAMLGDALHAGHPVRGRRGRGSLFRLGGRGSRVVGIMFGLGESSARQARQQADGKNDCSSVHGFSSLAPEGRRHIRGRGSPKVRLGSKCALPAVAPERPSRSNQTRRPQDSFGGSFPRVTVHDPEQFTIHGRPERQRPDGNGGDQTGLTAVGQHLAAVITLAACRCLCPVIAGQVMLAAVARRGRALFAVEGVSGRAGMRYALQNEGADGKQQDADRELAQSAASRRERNSEAPAHEPPAFSVSSRADALLTRARAIARGLSCIGSAARWTVMWRRLAQISCAPR